MTVRDQSGLTGHAPVLPNPIFIRRVTLKNYKSIAACDVTFRRSFTVLVGPNGAGKSNFLDAMRLVSDSMQTSLDHALRDRGGIKEVRRRSKGHPNHFSIRLDFELPEVVGRYFFRIGSQKGGAFAVQEEECHLETRDFPSRKHYFKVSGNRVTSSLDVAPPPVYSDRLYLVNVAGFSEFRPVYDALRRMAFYNPSPQSIRDLQSPDTGEVLKRDGSNIASVLGRLEARDPSAKQRVEHYLAKVVPGLRGVDKDEVGYKETLQFRQEVAGDKAPWRFPALNMSDGTLRVLGILVALFQSSGDTRDRVPLVGVEEPEGALNPGAAGVLLDGLREASLATQVVVTSHSPDLLDDKDLEEGTILAVVAQSGETMIGPLDSIGREALLERLYTVGELLRMGQLAPEESVLVPASEQPLLDFQRSTH